MNKFERIGINLQQEAETPQDATRKLNNSCYICKKHPLLCMDCDKCQIREAHDLVMSAFAAEEEAKAAKERVIERDAKKVEQIVSGMMLLLKELSKECGFKEIEKELTRRDA
jgi:hypothetical protein